MAPDEGVDVELSGAASSDDVGIVSYQWEQVGTAPAPATIVSPTAVDTKVTGLRVAGDYKFRLTVADKQDEKNSDEMTVTIKEGRFDHSLSFFYSRYSALSMPTFASELLFC